MDKYDWFHEFAAEFISDKDMQGLQKELEKPKYQDDPDSMLDAIDDIFMGALEKGMNKRPPKSTKSGQVTIENFKNYLEKRVLKGERLKVKGPSSGKQVDLRETYVQYKEASGKLLKAKMGVPARVVQKVELLKPADEILPVEEVTAAKWEKLSKQMSTPKLNRELGKIIKSAGDRGRVATLIYVRDALKDRQYLPDDRRKLSSIDIANHLSEIDKALTPYMSYRFLKKEKVKTITNMRQDLLDKQIPLAEIEGLSDRQMRKLWEKLRVTPEEIIKKKYVSMDELPTNATDVQQFYKDRNQKITKEVREQAKQTVTGVFPWLTDTERTKEINKQMAARATTHPVFEQELMNRFMKVPKAKGGRFDPADPDREPTLEDYKGLYNITHTFFKQRLADKPIEDPLGRFDMVTATEDVPIMDRKTGLVKTIMIDGVPTELTRTKVLRDDTGKIIKEKVPRMIKETLPYKKFRTWKKEKGVMGTRLGKIMEAEKRGEEQITRFEEAEYEQYGLS